MTHNEAIVCQSVVNLRNKECVKLKNALGIAQGSHDCQW